jgi:hypothetical protein
MYLKFKNNKTKIITIKTKKELTPMKKYLTSRTVTTLALLTAVVSTSAFGSMMVAKRIRLLQLAKVQLPFMQKLFHLQDC